MALFGFPKSLRITKGSDYSRVLANGQRIHTRHFVLVLCAAEHDATRLGIIVSKKVGNAVKRNRVKRRIREFFRLNRRLFPVSCDVVIIAKPGAHQLTYHDAASELQGRAPFTIRD